MKIANVTPEAIGPLLYSLVTHGLTFDAVYNPDKKIYTVELTGGY